MDYREEWLIYEDKLINDVTTEYGDFGVSVRFGVVPEGSPTGSPIYIPEGGMVFSLTVFDRNEIKKTECLFSTLEDVTFFLNNYVSKCHNILEVENEYMNYCISEDAIINKGYTS